MTKLCLALLLTTSLSAFAKEAVVTEQAPVKKAPQLKCKKVLLVGACDQKAICGVKFDDNSFADQAIRPVAGMPMCLEEDRGYWFIDNRR